MSKTNTQACPFCGAMAVMKTADEHTKRPPTHYCYCDNCCAKGPIATSAEDASKAWMARAGDRQATASKPEEPKALASATCSATRLVVIQNIGDLRRLIQCFTDECPVRTQEGKAPTMGYRLDQNCNGSIIVRCG
jgi:hypothetical protein